MINMEWLKNMNTVLSQVIELSESNPSFGNWLDRAAKQMMNSLSVPYTHPFTKSGNEESGDHTTEGANTAKNATVNPLELLEMVNKAMKQISVMGPFLQNLMNNQSTAGQSKSTYTAGPDITSQPYMKKTGLNSLMGILLSVFLIFIIFRFR